MISIDRDSSIPVHLQLTEQLRYLIATGRYQIGTRLPSTRVLAGQLDLSYHTVRSAYQQLEAEGLVEGKSGSGYIVRERLGSTRSERMEQGAAVVQDALRRLVGIGLDSEEVEYLVQEQLNYVAGEHDVRKFVFAAQVLEVADQCAAQLGSAFRQTVEAATLDAISSHSDADFVFASFPDVQQAMNLAPRSDVRGVSVHLNVDALERIVRLMNDDTLGVVSRTSEAIPYLLQAIRAESGFSGQMIAFASTSSTAELSRLVEQATLVAYTPASRRALLPLFKSQTSHVTLRSVVSEESMEALRQVIPF